MIVLDAEQEKFVYAYLEKHTGKKPPNGVKALSDYLEGLDKGFYKRMMTAYRVDKKRRWDKALGNASVNVVLSQQAHKRLKAMADYHGVTLSQFIENYMNSGFVASEQNFKSENDALKAQLERLNAENKRLRDERLKTDLALVGDPALDVVTCYVKCRCEICRKEFMGFAGSVTCNESRCKRQWMDKNIHSKLELARNLQKEKAVTTSL